MIKLTELVEAGKEFRAKSESDEQPIKKWVAILDLAAAAYAS